MTELLRIFGVFTIIAGLIIAVVTMIAASEAGVPAVVAIPGIIGGLATAISSVWAFAMAEILERVRKIETPEAKATTEPSPVSKPRADTRLQFRVEGEDAKTGVRSTLVIAAENRQDVPFMAMNAGIKSITSIERVLAEHHV